MALLKSALYLLELIEDRKYDRAVAVIEAAAQEGKGELEGFVPDLIYRVAYSFGNEDNPHLKILLVGLFNLMSCVQQKYRLCYELLTLRTSPTLTEVLATQLESLISTDFPEKFPKLWDQVCNELPLKLERRLCERLASRDEDISLAIVEAAHVLSFFNRIPFQVSYKFDGLVDRVLSQLTTEEKAAYPFLIWYAREHPFSPKLLCHTEPTVLIPNVYDQRYLRLRLTEGMCEYITTGDTPTDSSVKLLVNAFRFLLELCNDCREFHARHIKLYKDFFVFLIRFIDGIDSEDYRVIIRKMLEDIMPYFPLRPKVLLLKNVIIGVTSETPYGLKHESKVLAWLLDQFEHHLNEKVFKDELGSLFGILEDVAYDDIVGSRCFYASLLRIIRVLTRNCVNTKMLVELRKRLVVQLQERLVKHLQSGSMNKKAYHADEIMFFKPVCPSISVDEESSQLLMLLQKDCEETIVVIDKVLQISIRTEIMCNSRELLSFISAGKYDEALQFFQSFPQDNDESLRKLAIGTISEAVTKFRDNNNDNLRALVVSLLDAIEPEPLKFRTCFNFITERPTPHLTEILINQLGCMLMKNFKDKYPSEWQELCESLPLKLEENLPDENSENIECVAIDIARILHLFHDIPFVIPNRISKVFTAAVNTTEPRLPNAFPLLLFHSRTHPFSPKLLGIEEPTVLIPNVYSLYYCGRKLVEGLTIYLRENDYGDERYFVKPIVKALDVIVQLLQDLDVSDIVLCSDLILQLLHFGEDFDQGYSRIRILTRCLGIIRMFPSWPKCLLIKHLLSQVLDTSDLCFDNESSIVALFVDEYRRHLAEEPFQKELGSFFGMLEDVRYDDMRKATNYYVSIFSTVQLIALQRSNPTMLPELKTRILDRVYDQVCDYIRLDEVREKEKAKETTAPRLPQNLSGYSTRCERSMIERMSDALQLLLFSHDQAVQYIATALSLQ